MPDTMDTRMTIISPCLCNALQFTRKTQTYIEIKDVIKRQSRLKQSMPVRYAWGWGCFGGRVEEERGPGVYMCISAHVGAW